MDVGLEGPLKPSSSSAAAVAEYKRVQEALEPPGHCCEAVLFGKLEFIWLESPSKPPRGRLLQQLQRKLFQAQLMDCICKWHPAEFTHPGEADPLHYFSLLLFFGLAALAWLWFTVAGGNESAATVDFLARETYSLWSKKSNRNRSGLNDKPISDGINKGTKRSAAKNNSNSELQFVIWPSQGVPSQQVFIWDQGHGPQ